MPSMYQEWVLKLPNKAQAVLASANRGPDGERREDVMKTLVRGIRAMTQVVENTPAAMPGGYKYFDMVLLRPALQEGVPDIAKYTFHFVQHLYEAIEVLAYEHPVPMVREEFFYAYTMIAREMHLNGESEQQYRNRVYHLGERTSEAHK